MWISVIEKWISAEARFLSQIKDELNNLDTFMLVPRDEQSIKKEKKSIAKIKTIHQKIVKSLPSRLKKRIGEYFEREDRTNDGATSNFNDIMEDEIVEILSQMEELLKGSESIDWREVRYNLSRLHNYLELVNSRLFLAMADIEKLDSFVRKNKQNPNFSLIVEAELIGWKKYKKIENIGVCVIDKDDMSKSFYNPLEKKVYTIEETNEQRLCRGNMGELWLSSWEDISSGFIINNPMPKEKIRVDFTYNDGRKKTEEREFVFYPPKEIIRLAVQLDHPFIAFGNTILHGKSGDYAVTDENGNKTDIWVLSAKKFAKSYAAIKE
jgi:hypothetical protein